jgi:hypothetical protein
MARPPTIEEEILSEEARRPARVRREKPVTPGSSQRRFGRVLAARRGVLILKDGRCRAVVEAHGLNVAALPAGQQEKVLAGFERLLRSCAFETQFVVRTERVSLDAHAKDVERRVGAMGADAAALIPLASDYARFVRTVSSERTMLVRRCYVVVPAEPGQSWQQVRRQLNSRCGQVIASLKRVGMPAGRVSTADLLSLHAGMNRPGLDPSPWSCDADETEHAADDLARTAAAGAVGVLAPRPRLSARERLLRSRLVPRRWPGPLAGVLWLPRRRGTPDAKGQRRAEAELLAGVETAADRTVPTGRKSKDTLVLEEPREEWVRVFAVTGWPRVATLAWLTPLLTMDGEVDVSLRIVPQHPGKFLEGMERQWRRLSRQMGQEIVSWGQADPDTKTAVDDLNRMRTGIAHRRNQLYDAALYVRLRAGGETALGRVGEGLHAAVAAVIRELEADWRPTGRRMPDGHLACNPALDDRVNAVRLRDTPTLARVLPFVVGTSTGKGVLLGEDQRTHGAAMLDAFDVAAINASLAVIAPPGSGKSYLVKLLLLRHLYLGVLGYVIDPEGEYRRLVAAVGGRLVRFGQHTGVSLNGFDLPPSVLDEESQLWSDPVLEQTTRLVALLDAMIGPLNGDERGAASSAVLTAYGRAGIKAREPQTWGRPVPVLADLLPFVSKSVADRLAPFATGEWEPLFGRPTSAVLGGARLVVFDMLGLAEAPDEVKAACYHAVTQHIWREIRREKRPRLVVADEAATILSTSDGAKMMAEWGRRFRKWYAGLITIVQRVEHLNGNKAGADVLGTAAAKLLLGQDDESIDAVQQLFGLSDEDRADLLSAERGEGLLIGRGDRRKIKVLASRAEHRLVTTRPDEVAEIEAEERAARAAVPIPAPVKRPARRRKGVPA